jgi:hypothetical protein
MITMKDANSIWLESIALFQTVLAETVNEWGKAEDEEMMGVLNKVVNSDPELQARAQSDPEVSQILGGNDGNPDLQY